MSEKKKIMGYRFNQTWYHKECLDFVHMNPELIREKELKGTPRCQKCGKLILSPVLPKKKMVPKKKKIKKGTKKKIIENIEKVLDTDENLKDLSD